jgi:hypothetical protein
VINDSLLIGDWRLLIGPLRRFARTRGEINNQAFNNQQRIDNQRSANQKSTITAD